MKRVIALALVAMMAASVAALVPRSAEAGWGWGWGGWWRPGLTIGLGFGFPGPYYWGGYGWPGSYYRPYALYRPYPYYYQPYASYRPIYRPYGYRVYANGSRAE